jgi:hypothetical protein
MPDISRALLLPDLHDVSDGMLKTLALYWEEIVIPDYVERLLCGRYLETGEHAPSFSFSALKNDGVVVVHQTIADLPPAPVEATPVTAHKQSFSGCLADDEGIRRLLNALQPILDVLSEIDDLSQATPEARSLAKDELAPAVLDAIANMSRDATSLYLNRLQDAFELARTHNLAPVAHSVVSHVGSLVGDYTDDVTQTRREAALLSAAVDAFEVHADTPVEDILLFRARHKPLLGRFRASLIDLSAKLQENAAPLTLLASARDTYRNRVQPALADLEAAMNESRLQFLLRSLVGATAITLTPIEPVRAVDAGASLMGQTFNYRFSRDKLVREHPFGLLHKITTEFSTSSRGGHTELELAIQDPEHFLSSILGHPRYYGELLGGFWTAHEAVASRFARILDDPAAFKGLLSPSRVHGH